MASYGDCDVKYVEDFNRDGFVKIVDVFEPSTLQILHDKAMGNFADVMRKIEENNLEFGVGIKFGYSDIVQRHVNRYEMPYRMDSKEFGIVLENVSIMNVVKGIIGNDPIIVNRSLIISLPGAEDQSWHTDGPHVNVLNYEPCHCLNVFVPLVDVNLSNGPTEFRPQSQHLTRDFAKQYLAAFVSKRLLTPVVPDIDLGSVVLFDYRVLHRGRANRSSAPRPVLVYTFAKPWYQDTLNFPRRSVDEAIASQTKDLPPRDAAAIGGNLS